ncbi:UNVERIFIED_CONTAM: hypothetical protein Slati_2914400 [Sesamum latifolium]|uniref:Uncharacterized protein n=1 Tax=Sesamum latifolium TaxID=2727402 RepID=A0AAW2VGF7_9LAMI
MAYVGHNDGQEVPCDAQGCPTGCGISGATPLVRWVIEASTQKPRDPICGMCYWVLAIHEDPMAKMSGRGPMPHC